MESPENIKTIYERLKLRETMAHYDDWHIIGDLKAHNSSCGKYFLFALISLGIYVFIGPDFPQLGHWW